MAIETLGIGLIKAIPSIVRDTRRLAVEFRNGAKKTLAASSDGQILGSRLVQMHEIVEDYENMLLTLERGLQSEAKTRKALLEFQKKPRQAGFRKGTAICRIVSRHQIQEPSPSEGLLSLAPADT